METILGIFRRHDTGGVTADELRPKSGYIFLRGSSPAPTLIRRETALVTGDESGKIVKPVGV